MTCPDSPTTRKATHEMKQGTRHNAAKGSSDRTSIQLINDATDVGSATRDETVAGTRHRSLHPGEALEHFVLLRPLGEGGFGQVWLATDVRLGREVAIKLPHRRLRPESVEARRFQREAASAAKLTHPNLVPILEAALDDDHAYIVSEYCPGPTLSQWLSNRSSPVPVRLAVSIVAQLADGLRVAHECGLIHRDIKPSNIILTNADSDVPVPRLTDFGLARTSTDRSDTRVGVLIGSGPYMSPEQASGNTDDHGPHSDVHALGVLLYELLTGESPFSSVSELDTIRRIVSLDPPSIRQQRPAVSRDVSAVCQRCLEKQPSRRYRDAGELLADLRRVLAGHPPSARPVGHFGRTWRWATRNRGIASMAAIALIGIIVGVVGLSAVVIESRQTATLSRAHSRALSRLLAATQEQHATAEQLRVTADSEREEAQRTREESRRRSYTSDLSLAFLRLYQGHFGEVRRLLDRQLPQTNEPDLRTIEWNLLNEEVQGRYRVWGNHASRGTEVAILRRPDDATSGATVVTAAVDGCLYYWDPASGAMTHQLTGLEGRLDAIAAMPSGQLAISGPIWPLLGRSVVVIDPASGATQKVLHGHPTTIESIRVSSDASVIASASRYENIRCWSTAQQRSISIPNGTRNVAFGLTNDGSRLLTSSRNPHSLQMWDTKTGVLMDQWQTPSIGRVAMASQHPFAAYEVDNDVGFGLVRTDDLKERRWIASSSRPNAFAFSADDRYIAVADYRSGVELFERVPVECNKDDMQSKRPPDYRSKAYVAGRGGRIEDIKFTGASEFVTISIDGAVEHYTPDRPTHAIQAIAESDSHTMISVEAPPGILSLNHSGELTYFASHPDTGGDIDAAAGQRVLLSQPAWTSLAVTPDHETIAITDREGNLQLLTNWRDQQGGARAPEVQSVRMPSSSPTDSLGMSCFSHSGRFLAVVGNSTDLVVFDRDGDISEPIVRRRYPNIQCGLTFSPDERSLFICGYAGIEMIELSTDRSRFRLPSEDTIRTACFSPQGGRLVVGLENGSIASLDQQTGSPQFTMHSIDVTGDYSDRLASIRFLNESKIMTMTGKGTAHFWNLDQRSQLGSFAVVPAVTHGIQCQSFDISRGGDALTIAMNRDTVTDIHRWTWSTGD